MYKKIFKLFAIIILFLIFWFLSNGFLVNILGVVESVFFTAIVVIVFKYKEIKLKFWIYCVIALYATSAITEILKMATFPDVVASLGFGILIIAILVNSLRR